MLSWQEYEEFAKDRGIGTIDVDGTMGGGYTCSYVYFEPESVIKCIKKLENKVKKLEEIINSSELLLNNMDKRER